MGGLVVLCGSGSGWSRNIVATLLIFGLGGGMGIARAAERPKVSIVIDDLGYSKRYARAFLAMKEPITMAVLPHTPHAKWIAEATQKAGRELMLHLPMQSKAQPANEAPGLLKVGMQRQAFMKTLQKNLTDFEGYTGINNHMGSRLMSDSHSLEWVMESIADQGVFFLDSRTVGNSPAHQIANRYGIETASRDIFLDSQRDRAFISGQFDQLIKKALATGQAIAIGHPYQETVDVLERRLPELRKAGIDVVPVQHFLSQPARPYRAKAVLQAARSPALAASPPRLEKTAHSSISIQPTARSASPSVSVEVSEEPTEVRPPPSQVLSSARRVSQDRLNDQRQPSSLLGLPGLAVTVAPALSE